MREIFVRDILKLCNGEIIIGSENQVLEDFTNDTREVKDGYAYIGFKGEHNDGNLMFENALKNGAKVCILQSSSFKEKLDVDSLKKEYPDRTIVLVDNTIAAIQKIA